ncbi:MAG: Lrp/AsnC family transcriptional regulator [Chloroflexota bacterium]
MKVQLDEIDLSILREIQSDSRISNSELARRINLSQPATHQRLKRLQNDGIILKHVSLLNRDALGLDLICFFQVRLQGHSEEALLGFETAIKGFENVLECHYLTGEYDYLIKAVFANRRELELFERKSLRSLPGIAQNITSVVFSEIKSTTALPFPTS